MALAALCGGLLFADHARRLEMLAPPGLGNHCFLLHTFSETPKKRFEAFPFIDSEFYQDAPGILFLSTPNGLRKNGSIWRTRAGSRITEKTVNLADPRRES